MPRPKSKPGTKAKHEKYIREDQLSRNIDLDNPTFAKVAIALGVVPTEIPHQEGSPFAAFHKKDVSMINHHPMTWYIREHAAWLKRHLNKVNRKEEDRSKAPQAPWAETIRGRFPTFVSALQEMSDALTTIALFAQMKGNSQISSDRIVHCKKLINEFHYYVAQTHSLKRAFISVRGFYYEVVIEGVSIVWLVPHPFTIPADDTVNFEIMSSFLDLYENLVGFVNSHLFKELGVKYPPDYDQEKWDQGYGIDSFKAYGQATSMTVEETTQAKDEAPNAESASLQAALANALADQADIQSVEGPKGIFANFVFTISHETTAAPLAIVIKSLGGTIIYDENSTDPSITHTVLDRKEIKTRVLGRTYVQPQWIFDCLNQKAVIDAGPYEPGQPLPPHKSPFEGQQEDEEDIQNEKQADAGDEDSDAEVDPEIAARVKAMEYEQGIIEENTSVAAPDLSEKVEELKKDAAKRKKESQEERERLLAGTLSYNKKKKYEHLKAKEEKRRKPIKSNENDEAEDKIEEEPEE